MNLGELLATAGLDADTVRDIWRRIRRKARDQRGFTLIELLVVISILGILAAVVTMSMVGVTKVAQQRAADSELHTVQTAYDTMLADQGVPATASCDTTAISPTTAASDMKSFPSTRQPVYDATGKSIPQHRTVALAPTYLHTGPVGRTGTHGSYYCTELGQIQQADYNP